MGAPASDSPHDIESARRYVFDLEGPRFKNTGFSEPIYKGHDHDPADGLRHFGSTVPTLNPTDMDTIAQSLDYFAVNLTLVRPYVRPIPPYLLGGSNPAMANDAKPLRVHQICAGLAHYPKDPVLGAENELPVVITENGISNPDWVHTDWQRHFYPACRYANRAQLIVETGLP